MQTANSWTRDGATGNNFLANGGTEFNATSNLYDLDYRNYDPVLGRMNGVDPMAAKYASLTPYNYSFNDPVSFTDPNGADPSGYYENAEPIFESFTSWMYNPGYGWLQDDVIYQRLIGWKAPVARYAGPGLDWMFSGAGQGITGSGGWQASTFVGLSFAMPLGSFLNAALNSPNGGNWSGGHASFFSTQAEAFAAGERYMNTWISWREQVSNSYTLSAEGESFVKRWEETNGKPHLKMYNDRKKNGNATIGWGYLIHKGPINGKDKREKPFVNGITIEEAQALFNKNKVELEKVLNRQIKNRSLQGQLSQHQFDALFSLAFNGTPRGSGKVLDMIAERRSSSQIFEAIETWNRNDSGNVPRRIAEALLFEGGFYFGRQQFLWPPIIIKPY